MLESSSDFPKRNPGWQIYTDLPVEQANSHLRFSSLPVAALTSRSLPIKPCGPTRSRCYQFANGVSIDELRVIVYCLMRRQAWPAPRRSVCCSSSHWRIWAPLRDAQWVRYNSDSNSFPPTDHMTRRPAVRQHRAVETTPRIAWFIARLWTSRQYARLRTFRRTKNRECSGRRLLPRGCARPSSPALSPSALRNLAAEIYCDISSVLSSNRWIHW